MPSIIKNGRIYNASAASEITYNNTSSGLIAENTQAAIDEVNGKIPTIPTTYDADDITYDNTTSQLAANNAQAAIDLLAQEVSKLNNSGLRSTNYNIITVEYTVQS